MVKEIDWNAVRSVPILEVASAFGIEVRRNKSYCFGGHDKKTPSLSFNPEKNVWHCFGCNLGGGVVELADAIGKFNSKVAAAIWVQEHFLVPGAREHVRIHKDFESIRKVKQPNASNISTFAPDPEIYAWIAKATPLKARGRDYLMRDRGLTAKTIAHFGVGELESPKVLLRELRKVWQVDRLRRCGVVKESPEASGELQLVWWDHVLLFPFFENEAIQYLQGRRLQSGLPKYVNLRGVPVPIYNLDALTTACVGSRVLICEGVPDTMTAFQLNHTAIGCLGASAFKVEWSKRLVGFNLIVVPDADDAGDKFYASIRKAMSAEGRTVERIVLPRGEGLSSAYRKGLLKAMRGAND